MKVAFLDRDGTIVREHPDEVWPEIENPEFLPGAIEALRKLVEMNYEVIVVTNQCLIDEGAITFSQYEHFTREMIRELHRAGVALTDIFYCPHRRDAGCRCFKPAPGMIEQALERYPSIDLSQSFLAGDRPGDVRLADHFGMRSFSIGFEGGSPLCTAVQGISEIPALLSVPS